MSLLPPSSAYHFFFPGLTTFIYRFICVYKSCTCGSVLFCFYAYLKEFQKSVGRVAQSVQRLATGWTIRGSNPCGGEIFLTRQARPWSPPSLLYNGYQVFPGDKERPGRDADPSPPSSAVVKKGWSYASTPPMGRTACTEPQCLYKGDLHIFLLFKTLILQTVTVSKDRIQLRGMSYVITCTYKALLLNVLGKTEIKYETSHFEKAVHRQYLNQPFCDIRICLTAA